jgi:perosamine synthetase
VSTGTVPRQIPVARPVLGEAEAAAASRVILSGWVTQGPEVAAFEREFAAYVGAPHACAVSNCSVALHLALRVADVGRGDEVVTVSHSFIATANAVRYCGAVPVFVDIEPGTFNINPALIESAITSRTRAILVVHQLGMPCDLKQIGAIARRHGIPLIEDAACAIGSEVLIENRWERIGKPHGDIACFSFHPRKIMTTGDGGMLTTANAEWDKRFRLWRQHSMSVPDTVRHASSQVTFEEYPELGYNYRMTDIQAAVGRTQLQRVPGLITTRRILAERYSRLIAARLPSVRVPEEPSWARSNWQSYCVRLPHGVDQRSVMQALLDQGISTRRGVMCAHRERAYSIERWRCAGGTNPLVQSERGTDEGLILPLYAQMTEAEQDEVVDALVAALPVSRA